MAGRRATASVVVTGMGATTPLGGDAESMWDALLLGRSGAKPLQDAWAKELPVRFAAVAAVDPGPLLSATTARRADRSTQLALVAAQEAWRDAGLDRGTGVDPERLAVVVSSLLGVHTLLGAYDVRGRRGWSRIPPLTLASSLPNSTSAQLAITYGAQAAAHAPVSGCASSTEALALGADLIRLGRADVVIAGGADALIHPMVIGGFAAMRALSTRNHDPEGASRPFDRDRDGFVLGEGAGILVLESEEHARARGAGVRGTVLGAGLSVDGYRMAQPDATGRGAAKAMERALRDADLTPADIGHVNAHATSTRLGDLAEARALRRVLAAGTDSVPVSATKSMTGHLQGASGAVAAVATLLALRHRTAPATVNLDNPDPEVALDLVMKVPRALPVRPIAALCNSFGFGGHNASLVVTA